MKKRRMIFLPEVNPKSLVFFFERGDSGTSWSIRDYSWANRVKEFGPRDFPWTVDEIHSKARSSLDAPTVSTDNLAFWHAHTLELNRRYLGAPEDVPVAPPSPPAEAVLPPPPAARGETIPILHLERLLELPKGRKAQDMERILHSPNSEDWVTWNFFQILLDHYPTGWWGQMVSCARRRNPHLDFPFDDLSLPALKLWTTVPAPVEYEAQSRARMLASKNPEWMSRARTPDPVEGPSEIDIAFEHKDFLIFVEAKLGSDLSMKTSYDPARNQIARNIDCLLEKAAGRAPLFWLLVRDEEPDRAYVQLVSNYQSDPALLARDLPHRDTTTLEKMARDLTILLWSDFRELVCGLGMDAETNAVKQELERRILTR
jgi:hypothetical protein